MNLSANIIKYFIKLFLFSILLVLILLSGCVPLPSKTDIKTFLTDQQLKFAGTKQILLVIDNSSFFFPERKVYAFEKKADIWQIAFEPVDAVIGRKGFAPTGEKREGDGRTPTGIFSLKTTFGYDESINTKMPYRQALEDDLWIDDPEAIDYNRWVKKSKTKAKSYERMRRDDNLYEYGIVIEYNTDPVIKGYGSAIFLHTWHNKWKTTEGCVAVSKENILKILYWLDPQTKPLIFIRQEN
jgi:L,D-peptidoglycan transpeptidase YkuD (ErfK/YbiS/YcfS/YnhG family)